MSTSRRAIRLILIGAAAVTFTIAPTAVLTSAVTAPSIHNVAYPCYNGVTRLNPWAQSCTIPGPTNKIRGSAPDANAIIACRDEPGCLSYYVNNP